MVFKRELRKDADELRGKGFTREERRSVIKQAEKLADPTRKRLTFTKWLVEQNQLDEFNALPGPDAPTDAEFSVFIKAQPPLDGAAPKNVTALELIRRVDEDRQDKRGPDDLQPA